MRSIWFWEPITVPRDKGPYQIDSVTSLMHSLSGSVAFKQVEVIVEWNQKDLRKRVGLDTYLHKYNANYTEVVWPLSNLLKNDTEWCRNAEHQDAFAAIM
ncbi:unnamed protein product [Phytophthora fragariaefolia]|uniref:Unnamed protein product n=1 Tax=Phytophthora fragariaefolia TaxID=1490495 RepID=A0A9W7D859_9STRA|nr:unnamed protein product [Phytophthora fragariaefolia]